mgnify:CR=1 FL=1
MVDQFPPDYFQLFFNEAGYTYWSGSSPPPFVSTSSTCLVTPHGDLREDYERHGTYNSVYFVEQNLGSLPQWRLILDELIRLLRPGQITLLVVRLTAIRVTKAEFFSLLERQPHASFSQRIVPDELKDSSLIVLECFRSRTYPSLDSLGFGMISDGARPAAISQFIESILQIQSINHVNWQVALCGPRRLLGNLPKRLLRKVQSHLLFVEEPADWRTEGWITKKKNLLVQSLTSDNIVIVHDRYIVPQDFLKNLREFGADFDVIAPGQTRNGLRFPDWTATSAEWATDKTYLLPYNVGSPFVYINGGAIIAKRQVLVQNGWNDLLFWDQCEDIELTRRLEGQGIIARNAPRVRLEATEARSGYEQAFERTRHDGSPMPADNAVRTGETLRLHDLTYAGVERRGVIAWPYFWRTSSSGLIAAKRQVELTLCNVSADAAYICLTGNIAVTPNLIPHISVNGIAIQARRDGTALILPIEGIPKAAGRQLVVNFHDVGGLIIESITLGEAGRRIGYPVSINRGDPDAEGLLGEGWWGLEQWGTWSAGTHSTLYIPTSTDNHDRDIRIWLRLKTLPKLGQRYKFVGISCNGFPISVLKVVADGKERSYSIRVPSSIAQQNPLMIIGLAMPDASSPSEQEQTNDRRLIGIGLTKIGIRAAPSLPRSSLRERIRRLIKT